MEQVGGSHYQKYEYQPYEFFRDIGADFFLGSAIKYVVRYKDKNGQEDIDKAVSYLEEMLKFDEYYSCKWYNIANLEFINRFLAQFDKSAAKIIHIILEGRYKYAIDLLKNPSQEEETKENEYLTHDCDAC